jgi:peptide/nickel transport system substrate-binding protein
VVAAGREREDPLLSTSARQDLYNTVQSDSASDAFMAFLYNSPYAYATTSSVHGFYVTPLGNYHLENVWLSK